MKRELIDKIKLHPLCKKNLYPYIWQSGSSTTVYPIEVSENQIILQWSSNKNCPAFIRWIESFDIVDKAQFWKSDGSCPSTITIYLK